MNNEMIQGGWNEIKGKIKTQWAKFTDDDLAELNGNLDQLAGKIQQVYGRGKEEAEHEFNEFKKTIAASMNTAATVVLQKVDALLDDASKK